MLFGFQFVFSHKQKAKKSFLRASACRFKKSKYSEREREGWERERDLATTQYILSRSN